MSNNIRATINGKKELISSRLSIKDFLNQREENPNLLAVEVNGKFLDKSSHESLILKSGDTIEYFAYLAGVQIDEEASMPEDNLLLNGGDRSTIDKCKECEDCSCDSRDQKEEAKD